MRSSAPRISAPKRSIVRPRREVDADARALLAREPRGRCAAASSIGAAHQRVAGEVQRVAAVEPLALRSPRRELRSRAAVRRHRPVAVRLHERHDDAGAPRRAGRSTSTPRRVELAAHERRRRRRRPARRRCGACAPSSAAHAATFAAWPPGASVVARRRVVAGGEPRVEPHDHVEQQITERADQHRTIVSWTARTGAANGSAPSCTAPSLGASAAVAAARRRRPMRAAGPRPPASPRSRTRRASARRWSSRSAARQLARAARVEPRVRRRARPSGS